jgi:hypothetical protein
MPYAPQNMAATWLLLGFLVVFVPVWLSYEYYQYKTGIPVFPTMPPMRRKIIELLKKDAEARGLRPYTIIDLGSGSGQLTWRIARAMPEAHVIGLELAFIPWLRSVVRQRLFGPKNLEYKRVNFWTYDVGAADALTAYLLGTIMDQVSEKLRKELKPGALVLTNKFYLNDKWKPLETFYIRIPMKARLSVYRQS